MKHEEPNATPHLSKQASAMSSNPAMTLQSLSSEGPMIRMKCFDIDSLAHNDHVIQSAIQNNRGETAQLSSAASRYEAGLQRPLWQHRFSWWWKLRCSIFCYKRTCQCSQVKYLLELMVSQRDLVAGIDFVAHVDSAVQLAAEGNYMTIVNSLQQVKRNHPKNFGWFTNR
jgi:hypothetical protein